MPPKGTSVAWDHFTDIGQWVAECKICKMHLSFKSTVSNLTKHLKKRHPLVNLIPRNVHNISASTLEPVPGPSVPSTSSSSTNVPIAAAVDQNQPTSIGTVRVVQTGSKNIASYIYKRNAEKCKSDIDEMIMDLFILDFQPFRILEDTGFRKLIQSAFPFYTIPSRKYFSNNLLPGRYESVRALKMHEIENDVESICITADVWTSSVNDSYMAITGHYIETKVCTLKSVLLDCVLLEGSHTGINLASEMLRVTEEWKVTKKIILAVTDNGANIKKAVEKDLGWKHFGCYAHTLNLAVQEALANVRTVTALIEKVKTAVAYFKRSAQAWEKLKKFQVQAGKTVKRPLQNVNTRWNSTFYMLERFSELREEINSAVSNLNASAMTLTVREWELCESLCKILKPCEEVTKEVSAQKYVTGSIVIPITTALIASLENIDTHSDLEEIQALQQDLIGALKKRFGNLDKSRTFTICMFLDPRFKLYFEDPNVAENTKQHVIQVVTTLINKDDNQVRPLNEEQEATLPTQTQSQSTIWRHYNEKMRNLQPKGTAQSRAIIEVQRYLEDAIVTPDNNISPLDWWKQQKTVYPNLYNLAVRKLNVMATSVPCERIFSACGILLNDRRTRLGHRKVQQLMFLKQNSD